MKALGFAPSSTSSELTRRIGRGFDLAKDILNSSATRRVCSIYDLSPQMLGRFDFVFCGSVLLHLACPPRALCESQA